jgi:hypothetical protein
MFAILPKGWFRPLGRIAEPNGELIRLKDVGKAGAFRSMGRVQNVQSEVGWGGIWVGSGEGASDQFS